ncbi:MAG TPA: TonB-dependent receptor, partial [Flavipsychrobacter sp.]|nr:TonB-dependent receptor [Flavipsychrobacter sp.]
MKQFFYLLLLLLSAQNIARGQNFTVSGYVKDAASGEDIIGAVVSVKEMPSLGAATNAYGFYSLLLPMGNYTLQYKFMGYQSQERDIILNANMEMSMNLPGSTAELAEVVIGSEKSDRNVNSTDIGMFRLDPKSIESVPVLFGEKDILKVLQMTPGVKAAGEGNAGFYVRGGSADQNLVVLDEALVYNASHMLGFFSVFNSDAVKDATIYKGGIPAQYGGRSASVLDVKMKDGNQKKFSASGGIGTISSRLTLEGPIVKDKGAFIISARRTYADLYLLFSKKESLRKSKLYFYDLNLKANYKISEKDRIFLSGYFGRDVFGLDGIFGTDWGNATGTLRWNHVMNPKTFTNTSFIFSNYSNALQFGSVGVGGLKASSQIRDWNIKHDISYTQNSNSNFKFGANLIQHTFIPGKIALDNQSGSSEETLPGRKSYEGAIYAQHDLKIGSKFAMLYGLRYSGYNTFAKETVYTFDNSGATTDVDNYDDPTSISYYGGLEPRMSLKYSLNDKSSVKASYNRMYQYLHQLSNATT